LLLPVTRRTGWTIATVFTGRTVAARRTIVAATEAAA
jgi:hypothetical protein